ncbi:hypothetical protein JCM15765_29700 [Paradesulfitobacterium aromaticivorans]
MGSANVTLHAQWAPTAAPALTGFTWAAGSTVGTTQATAVQSGTLKYVVGAAGAQTQAKVRDAATAYTSTLTANTDIAVTSGQYIYTVSVDGSGNVLTWTDVSVADTNIKAAPTLTLQSITVSPSSASIQTGGIQTYNATANYSDGTTQDITSTATWTSSNPTVATMSGNTATGVAAGTTVVSAVYGSQTGTANLTVTTPVPTYSGGGNNSSNSGNGSNGGSSSTPTTVTGSVVDATNGTQISNLTATVTTDSNGNATVSMNAAQTVVLKQPDGKTSPLSDLVNIAINTAAGNPVTMINDGTITCTESDERNTE